MQQATAAQLSSARVVAVGVATVVLAFRLTFSRLANRTADTPKPA